MHFRCSLIAPFMRSRWIPKWKRRNEFLRPRRCQLLLRVNVGRWLSRTSDHNSELSSPVALRARPNRRADLFIGNGMPPITRPTASPVTECQLSHYDDGTIAAPRRAATHRSLPPISTPRHAGFISNTCERNRARMSNNGGRCGRSAFLSPSGSNRAQETRWTIVYSDAFPGATNAAVAGPRIKRESHRGCRIIESTSKRNGVRILPRLDYSLLLSVKINICRNNRARARAREPASSERLRVR